MGAFVSKEELLYKAAERRDLASVVSLRREGASLEFKDSKGRTPLLAACSQPDGLEAARCLLSLGANIHACRPGPEGGFPVHQAAKKGLNRTLELLLSYGADLMVANDMGFTPLFMARERGHATTVRMIEDRIGLFSGNMRIQTVSTLGGIMETFASSWVYKKVWVVVLPSHTHNRMPPRFELAVYSSVKAPVPSSVVPLDNVSLTIVKGGSDDSALQIEDHNTSVKVKVAGDRDAPGGAAGANVQVQRLYHACRGVPQGRPPPLPVHTSAPQPRLPAPGPVPQFTNSPQPRPPPPGPVPQFSNSPVHSPVTASSPSRAGGSRRSCAETFAAAEQEQEEIALKLAIEASLRMAEEEEAQRNAIGRSLSSSTQNSDVSNNAFGASGSGGIDARSSLFHAGDIGRTDWVATGGGQAGGSPEAWPALFSDRNGEVGILQNRFSPSSSGRSAGGTTVAPYTASPLRNTSFSTDNDAGPSAPPLPIQLTDMVDYSAIAASAPPERVPERLSNPVAGAHAGHGHMESVPTEAGGASDGVGSDAGQAGRAGDRAAEQRLCPICMDNPPEGACVPCGHLAGCMECLQAVQERGSGCPVCRAPIREVIRVYQV
eukprot:TRINITY_DN1057_c0_g1_i1.p1 TRINITY_DN1057_c0_g1~~TRINITY_DN1057_c0_g1_i1.p1  ORF type:complete len:604 (+),score=85.97 TRINITY_DN1057_c0_g1_i1:174-1985(+)